uniref:DNA-directed RNA polymerases I and III subunit RPAC2 n=1 Tax=Caligus rogercresseyi TaxID=217165 RepID=C1BP53_CALRO|nr:DNA-directed RNA polymerases I and III subunit RPAC2 [Caligus rogercresseyi]
MDTSTRRLVMVAGDGESGESCRTFIFKGENHTLGNALRSVILQNPDVLFCGYSIPHPAEDQMPLRIQTVSSVPAQDALRRGLEDLKDMCSVVSSKFNSALVH